MRLSGYEVVPQVGSPRGRAREAVDALDQDGRPDEEALVRLVARGRVVRRMRESGSEPTWCSLVEVPGDRPGRISVAGSLLGARRVVCCGWETPPCALFDSLSAGSPATPSP